ncbi:nSTAND1 domain-containing NTPase [Paraglaciecola sp.]|uniref:nSTAND1 domain-containing NTPase n=1 Tax=Paraglaciecola sp. TaxID=1920173 RepID=UPI003EF9F65A
MNSKLFFVGEWQVTPSNNTVRKGQLVIPLEPKAMDVLVLLCHQQGEVLSADKIISQCWGNNDIGDNPIHKVITQLRKALGDKASDPTFIETIRKRGYRVIAHVDFPLGDNLSDTPTTTATSNSWSGQSPFPGLSAFEPKQASVFFGRNAQIVSFLERLSAQINQGRAFCLLLGPSGTGKSSLVNAGVLPRLLFEGGFDGIRVLSHSSLDLADVTKNRLFIDLASTMLDWDINDNLVFVDLSAETLAEKLRTNIAEVLAIISAFMQANQTGHTKDYLLLFVDRIEVILASTIFDDFERRQFIGLIDLLASSGHVMVISACRNDFYPLLAQYKTLMQGKDSGAHFDLLPPSRNELMQMIRMPAQIAGLSWAVDPNTNISLDEILCDHAARNPDSLPMLQYTLQELYLQRSDNNEMQVSVYQSLGGIEGAIGKKAEEIFIHLPTEQQGELAFLFSQLVTVNGDSDGSNDNITSKAARWSQLANVNQKSLVQAMVDSRLFVSHLNNQQACFSLAHEALLRRWPRASQWITAHQESITIKSRLRVVSQRWIAEGKSTSFLLASGKPLLEAKQLKHNPIFSLEPEEIALITASEKRFKLRKWLTRSVMVVLCLLTITSVTMSYKSYQSENLAQQKRAEAESLLGFMVGEFADKLRSVKRMDLLDGISNKALEYFSQQEQQNNSIFSFGDSSQNFKASFQHAQTLGAMGEVARSRNKLDEAQRAFAAAKQILDKLYISQPFNLELLTTLGANAFWLGQLAMDNAEFPKAKVFFESYLKYSQIMVEFSPSDIEAKRELSYAYMAKGSVYIKSQQNLLARDAFERALDIQIMLVENLSKDYVSIIDLADTLEWLAESQEQLGDLQDAVKTRIKAQDIVNDLLIAHKGSADLLENLAYSYFNAANVLYYLSEYKAASQAILVSIKHFNDMLAQDSSNKIWQLELLSAQAFHYLMLTIIENGDSQSIVSLDDFNKLLDRAEKFPFSLVFIINTYQHSGNWGLAEKALNLAKPILENLVKQQPDNSILVSSLSNIYLTKAKQGKLNQTKDNQTVSNCAKAINILQPNINIQTSYELSQPYVKAYDCLGKINEVENFVQRLENMQITNYRF